jgi:hypothetical protein
MDKNLAEIQLLVVNKITDLLVDLSDDGSTEFDIEERRDYFSKVADLIVEELGIEVMEFSPSGEATARLVPINGWDD